MNKFNFSIDLDVTRKGILAKEILTDNEHPSSIQLETDITSPDLAIESSYILPSMGTSGIETFENCVVASFTISSNAVASFTISSNAVVANSGNLSFSVSSELSVAISDKLSAFRKEQQVFESMKEELKKNYAGKWVAIHGEQVVDSDADESALIDRFFKKYGNVPVYIDNPEENEYLGEIVTPFAID